MTVLIDAQGLVKGYAGQQLFDQLDLTITSSMKLGLIGPNGAGKTTLLRILLQEEEPDLGTVHLSKDLRLGHLPQHDPFEPQESVLSFLQRWSGQEPWTCAALAARFGIDASMIEQPLGTCSGGWRTRAKLTAVLLKEPNLLILDEPTNFLDLRTQILLEDFLASWHGAALVVSHDRPFLAATCSHTAELCRAQLRIYPGPIDVALQAWTEEEERLARRAHNLQGKARQLQQFVDSNRANANTASQARSKAKQLQRLHQEIPQVLSMAAPHPKIRVPLVERRDGPACQISDLSVGYGEEAVATCLHLEIRRGERLAVMGDNGQGKTTFLRTLSGSLPVLAGSLRWTQGAEISVYGQHVYQDLPADCSVLGYLNAIAGDRVSGQEVLAVAGSFLFRGDAVEKKLGICSGGERARAVLAGILLSKASVLVLDEPTNHLDVATVDSLAQALCSYGGTLLLASHDRAFVEAVCTGIIEVDRGGIARWPGEPTDYCQHLRQHLSLEPPPDQPRPEKQQTQPGRAKQLRQLNKRIASSERQMAQISQHIAAQEARLVDPQADHQQVAEELAELQHKHSQCEEEWLLLASQREELEAL